MKTWCQTFEKNVLLRVDDGMGDYLLIALSRHSERDDFSSLLRVF